MAAVTSAMTLQDRHKSDQDSALSDHLWHLEEMRWTTGRDSAVAVRDASATAIHPDLLESNEIWQCRPADTVWRMVKIDTRAIKLQGVVAMLTYRIRAEKADAPIYHAICASTWFDDAGTWQRLSHHHTPLA